MKSYFLRLKIQRINNYSHWKELWYNKKVRMVSRVSAEKRLEEKVDMLVQMFHTNFELMAQQQASIDRLSKQANDNASDLKNLIEGQSKIFEQLNSLNQK